MVSLGMISSVFSRNTELCFRTRKKLGVVEKEVGSIANRIL
jgi:hypothetical protein